MTGDQGSDDPDKRSAGERSGEAARLKAEVLARLRAQLALMQGQVRRLDQALNDADSARTAALARLQTLRGTADRLERVLREQEPGAPKTKAASDIAWVNQPSSPWRPIAEGGPLPVRFLVAVDLRDHHLDALLATGILPRERAQDNVAVAGAIQDLLDRWSRGTASIVRGAGEETTQQDADPAAAERPGTLFGRVSASLFDWRRQMSRAEMDRNAAASAGTGGDNVVILPFRAAARPPGATTPPAADLAAEDGGPALPLEANGIERVDDQRRPDAGEGDEAGRGEGFAIGQDGKQEMPGRRDVLQQAEGHQSDAMGAGDEQDQR